MIFIFSKDGMRVSHYFHIMQKRWAEKDREPILLKFEVYRFLLLRCVYYKEVQLYNIQAKTNLSVENVSIYNTTCIKLFLSRCFKTG